MTVVEVSCPVFPSEDKEKVISAIKRIFPDIELTEEEDRLIGNSDLAQFSKLIRKQEILDATRAVMFSGKKGNTTVLRLNKQVATVGKVSFTEERCTLGYIRVFIRDDDLEALIDRVAPVTVDGKEVFR